MLPPSLYPRKEWAWRRVPATRGRFIFASDSDTGRTKLHMLNLAHGEVRGPPSAAAVPLACCSNPLACCRPLSQRVHAQPRPRGGARASLCRSLETFSVPRAACCSNPLACRRPLPQAAHARPRPRGGARASLCRGRASSVLQQSFSVLLPPLPSCACSTSPTGGCAGHS